MAIDPYLSVFTIFVFVFYLVQYKVRAYLSKKYNNYQKISPMEFITYLHDTRRDVMNTLVNEIIDYKNQQRC